MVQGRQVSQNAGPAFVVSLKLRTSPGAFLRASPGASKIEGRTATRPWAYRLGTLDIEWQCGMRCPVRSPPSGSVRCTATRPRAYRTHCHSPLGVPIRYARCRVAVNDALPLALERTIPYVHRRVAVRTASRLAPFASCLAPLASIRRSYCRRSRPERGSWAHVPLRVALSRRRAQGG